jgi:hypothetical protein
MIWMPSSMDHDPWDHDGMTLVTRTGSWGRSNNQIGWASALHFPCVGVCPSVNPCILVVIRWVRLLESLCVVYSVCIYNNKYITIRILPMISEISFVSGLFRVFKFQQLLYENLICFACLWNWCKYLLKSLCILRTKKSGRIPVQWWNN